MKESESKKSPSKAQRVASSSTVAKDAKNKKSEAKKSKIPADTFAQLPRIRTAAEKDAHRVDQKKIMAGFKVGQRDPNNDEIIKIYALDDQFVIYEIKTQHLSESLRTYMNTIDEDDRILYGRYTAVRSVIGEAKSIIYKAVDPIVFKVSLAHCISNALHGSEQVREQFTNLIDKVNKEYKEQFQHRANYLKTAGVIVLLNVILSIIAYTTDMFATLKQINLFIYVATAGSIDGFVSVSRRLKDTVFERGVESNIFVMYAAERILVAVFAAMVVLFAIKCELVFGMLSKKKQNPLYSYIVFGILAGFSETFLPNLLIKLENKA